MQQLAVKYDGYPWTTPFLENVLWLSIYVLGSIIFGLIGTWAAVTYATYCVVSMYLLIPRFVCTYCSYFGRRCHSGQGRIAALLFAKRNDALFGTSFKCMRFVAPVFLAPLIAGITLWVFQFSWEILGMTVLFGILALYCTRVVTMRAGCPHCKQEAVCPAYAKAHRRQQ
jgi:hypothetical protein